MNYSELKWGNRGEGGAAERSVEIAVTAPRAPERTLVRRVTRDIDGMEGYHERWLEASSGSGPALARSRESVLATYVRMSCVVCIFSS